MLPIRTQRLELRDFVPPDFEAVHHYASDPDVTRFLSWGPNDEAAPRKEGRLRQDTRVGGRWRDSLIYARLADEREAQ